MLNKLHIRGVDSLHTDDIKAYIKHYHGAVGRVEWIDDNCANIVFDNESAARDAIVSLSAVEIADATALVPGECVPAKPLKQGAEVLLQVRFAVRGDRKQAGAAQRSRYYLLHPEFDPEERRRKAQEVRSRYRDRDGSQRRNGDRSMRQSDEEIETFEASMYDDAPRARQDRSPPEHHRLTRPHATENAGKELFARRASRRNRSASPQRRNGEDTQMDSVFESSHQNRRHARSIKSHLTASNSSKELFPMKSSGRSGQLDQLEKSIGSAHLRDEDLPQVTTASLTSSAMSFNIRGTANQKGQKDDGLSIKGAASANARELFPDKLGHSNAGKELLDLARTKRRQKAHDLFL